jgi:hypothetical protein
MTFFRPMAVVIVMVVVDHHVSLLGRTNGGDRLFGRPAMRSEQLSNLTDCSSVDNRVLLGEPSL